MNALLHSCQKKSVFQKVQSTFVYLRTFGILKHIILDNQNTDSQELIKTPLSFVLALAPHKGLSTRAKKELLGVLTRSLGDDSNRSKRTRIPWLADSVGQIDSFVICGTFGTFATCVFDWNT